MAIRYLIDIGINDDLKTVIRKCNQNFKLVIAQQIKQSQIIDRDALVEIEQSIENIIDDYTAAITEEAATRRNADDDIIDNIIPDAIAAAIASVYKYKGSVHYESQLPVTGMHIGDVYNIETASTYGAAGANVAWNGSAWDSLGEIFTIASIANNEIDTIVAS